MASHAALRRTGEPADLTRIFGADFTTAVAALPVGEWSAPIASAYGLHIVRVEARLPAAPPPFEDVRGQLLHAWLRDAPRRPARAPASRRCAAAEAGAGGALARGARARGPRPVATMPRCMQAPY